MPSFGPQVEPGAFIQTTSIYDIQDIQNSNLSPEIKELLIRLTNNINSISLLLNIKDTGYYPLTEFVNGQAFFPNPALSSSTPQTPVLRQVFRLVVLTGQLPNTGLKTIPHGLTTTSTFTATRVYGAATDTTAMTYISLPYASPTLANNIELFIDNTNVNIITGSNRSNFNVSYVVFEYLKF